MKRFLLMTLLLVTVAAWAENEGKPSLDHSVYDDWKNLTTFKIPFDGKILVYETKAQEGDGELVYKDLQNNKDITLPKASHISMNRSQTWALAKRVPAYKDKRQAKIDKKTGEKGPQDSLLLVNLTTGETTTIANVKDYKIGNVLGKYFAYKQSKQEEPADSAAKAQAKKDVSWKTRLYIYGIDKLSVIDTLKDVRDAAFDFNSTKIVYTTKPDKKDSTARQILGIYYPETGRRDTLLALDHKAYLGKPEIDETGRYVTFLANADSCKNNSKTPDLYIYDGKECRVLLGANDERLPKNCSIKLRGGFSADSTRYFFGIHPIAKERDTTSVPDFERAKLVIWTWNEEYLRTEQKRMAKSEREKSYLSSISLDGSGDVVTLEDELLRKVTVLPGNVQDYVLAITDKPYRIQQQWDQEILYDIYKVSLSDGSKQKIRTAAKIHYVGSSPNGRWYSWYDYESASWKLYDIVNDVQSDISAGLDGIFYDDENDRPMLPDPVGLPRWQKDCKFIYLQDKYDIWKIDPTGAKPAVRITEGYKTNTSYSFNNLVRSNEGKTFFERQGLDPKQPIYFNVFNHDTKEKGVAVLEKGKLRNLQYGPYSIKSFVISTKGKKPVYAIAKGNYETGMRFYLSKDNLKTETEFAELNPQQHNYNWGTVELIDWTVKDGSKAEGLLFKPENFDPAKKYPVMVYFYEKYSDDLYSMFTLGPSRSTINIPYFVSNEYIVFVPDIKYTIGHPGESAMDYILSGCDKLCENSWVNADKMGIQGQSWGGYQVAYLMTHTNRFAAAGAGAPVSNMTSAYGGIRWGSGMVRQFQYEQQQSRIGKDLWEGFDLYVENSPLFFVPNVTTPVLIMHNDKDDAVPWWQGIEFFTALRRCGKQAWMLQYVDEVHNLSQRKNAKDLSVRLSDFFDHFLKDAPMPSWMENGVQAWDPEAE